MDGWTLDFEVHATPDGAALRYRGRIVDEFPTVEGAALGWKAAREALAMLDSILSRKV